MLNTFNWSLIIWKPAVETWVQEMNGGPGTNWGSESWTVSTLEIILYLPPLAVATNGYHFEHLQWLSPSPSRHPHLITNKPALFRLLVRTVLATLRNGWRLSWLKEHILSPFDFFQQNLVLECIFYCLPLA